ncbi:meiotic recombination protein SPO11-like isoform X1 [Stegodyphus dumicola]|uniref:meiotic recombination protein SPO11-like isoform X1 n=1 Tax=Stegodyphus dumicola TaxID=202533 RepID=UPI0015AAA1AE|nr:meiotic recombination protein SPO11-like isoform X1 [Stegodyphus dumicola]
MELKSKTEFRTTDENFWMSIDKLRRSLILFSNQRTLKSSAKGNEDKCSNSGQEWNTENSSTSYNRKQLLEKIDGIFRNYLQKAQNDEITTLKLPKRDIWENINYEPDCGIKMKENPVMKTVGGSRPRSSSRFVRIMHVLTKIYNLIKTNTYRTKRELYYEDVTLFKSQATLDRILDDIACFLNVPKIQLHVLTTAKGCIAGNLRFKDSYGNYIECDASSEGTLIPNDVCGISYIQSDARFILLVEKSSVFQMLLDSKVTEILSPCILITGKGFPDVNTREMLRKLWETLRIPILGLVDADPYGIEILNTYRYGSKAMSFDVENLAVTEIRWLGLLPSDIERLNLPTTSIQTLSRYDILKAKSLLNRNYMQANISWKDQIEIMLHSQQKAEIEGLSKINPLFLPKTYLPGKIKCGGWI